MHHQVDLTKLSVVQLLQLNQDVVARVRYLRQKESYQALAKLNLGDQVSFRTDKGTIKGTIVRLNKKTVSIHTDDHQQWNVSPHVLKKVSTKQKEEEPSNLFTLRPS